MTRASRRCGCSGTTGPWPTPRCGRSPIFSVRSDGYHRVSVTDALIAAAAAERGVAVLHRDAHFDRAEVLAFDSVALPVP
jgi:hypothetical protein